MGVINLGALVEKLRKKLSGDFVSKTTYPSGSDAGVIKVDSTYATAVTTGGKLKATEIAAASYSEANDAAFVSKATLDNLIAAGTLGGSGLTWTVLWEEGEEPKSTGTGSANKITIDESLYDYKALIFVFRRAADFTMPASMYVVDTTYTSTTIPGCNANGNAITIGMDITEHDIIIRDGTGINGYWRKIIGIK